MSTALTKPERSTLAECEAVIERGMESFIEVGNALLRIRDGRLYDKKPGHAGFGTFQEYCEAKWRMDRRSANRMIDAAAVTETLGPIGPKPTSESVARPLASLPIAQRRAAWKEATETAKAPGKPTAKEVEAVVRRIAPSQPTSRTSPSATREQNSELLSLLKSYWTAATRAERAQFLLWIKQQ